MASGQERYATEIRRALSDERLESYGFGRSDDEKLANYLWNIALCEALYPSLHALEIVLRNAMFRAGENVFGHMRTADVACWLDADPPILHPGEVAAVEAAKTRLVQRNTPLLPGRLIAELSFGFWTALFDVRYEQTRILWPRLLSGHFLDRATPRSMRSRKALSPLLNRIRHLRNRVFHHEPVWHWSDLPRQHALVLDVIGWFNPTWRTTVEPNDRFPATYRAGTASFLEQIRHHTGSG